MDNILLKSLSSEKVNLQTQNMLVEKVKEYK